MNTDKNNGGPAFPSIEITSENTADYLISSVSSKSVDGMSLRDWFAGMALQGMCANPDISARMSEEGMKPYEVRDSFASSAYAQADDMITERSKE